jgi:UDP-N-acetylmuramate dehydrogenase
MVKIPAAWLIDEMGWAGKKVGNCGVWRTQALNLVNYGNATPDEYLSFIKMVKDAVFERYSINLETEVVIV